MLISKLEKEEIMQEKTAEEILNEAIRLGLEAFQAYPARLGFVQEEDFFNPPHSDVIPMVKLTNGLITILYHVGWKENHCIETFRARIKGSKYGFCCRYKDQLTNPSLCIEATILLKEVRKSLESLNWFAN